MHLAPSLIPLVSGAAKCTKNKLFRNEYYDNNNRRELYFFYTGIVSFSAFYWSENLLNEKVVDCFLLGQFADL